MPQCMDYLILTDLQMSFSWIERGTLEVAEVHKQEERSSTTVHSTKRLERKPV